MKKNILKRKGKSFYVNVYKHVCKYVVYITFKIINKNGFLVFFWNGVPLCIGGQIYPKQHLQSEFL